MDPIEIRDGLVIPETDLTATFIQSGGPGGQHVNKVATGVQLRFALASTGALPEDVRLRLRERAGRRLTRHGDILLTCRRHRSQAQNLDACRERLRRLVLAALEPERPRKPTRPGRAARERRLAEKARQAQKKRRRRSPPVDEDG